MTDFEQQLRDSLTSAAGQAPGADPQLALGARVRDRRRRRTTMATVLATACAIAVVPIGVILAVRGGGHDASPATATESPAPLPGAGWRVETWRDLTLQVPDSWGYGALDQWCTEATPGRSAGGPGVVQRPEGGQTEVLCAPQVGFGLMFLGPDQGPAEFPVEGDEVVAYEPGDGDAAYPPGAWLAFVRAGHAAAAVVAPDRATAQRIRDSAQQVDRDAHGCATRDSGVDEPTNPAAARVSVCRYGADGWLQQSDQLSESDTQRAWAALSAAPTRSEVATCAGQRDFDHVTLGTGNALGTATVVWDSDCAGDNGVFLSGTVRELTPRVLYWALAPGWSGGWDPRQVPMPTKFRRLGR